MSEHVGEAEADVAAGDDPRARLFAVCSAYLEFAQQHPGRYRTMFGGVWMPDLQASSLTEDDMYALGRSALELLGDVLDGCVRAGIVTTTDLEADAVALWLGLHGLAHQRSVTVSFPWPSDIAERLIGTLAHLAGDRDRPGADADLGVAVRWGGQAGSTA